MVSANPNNGAAMLASGVMPACGSARAIATAIA